MLGRLFIVLNRLPQLMKKMNATLALLEENGINKSAERTSIRKYDEAQSFYAPDFDKHL